MNDIQVDFVEIGFRSYFHSSFHGPCFFTTENFLQQLTIPAKVNLAVMINAAELIKLSDNNISLSRLFVPACDSCISLVRIAAHPSEIFSISSSILELIDIGYKVAINIMQASQLDKLKVADICNFASTFNLSALYLADSMGSMRPSDVRYLSSIFFQYYDGPLGLHTHDNLGLALENSLTALDCGFQWLDSTVMGMGRGPGNLSTEYIALELQRSFNKRLDISSLLSLISDVFLDLKAHYRWGTNPHYFFCGLNSIHPSFAQNMLSDSRYSYTDVFTSLSRIKDQDCKRFDPCLLDETSLHSLSLSVHFHLLLYLIMKMFCC